MAPATAAIVAIAAIVFVLEVILWPTGSCLPNLLYDLLAERCEIPVLQAKALLHFCPNVLGRHTG